MNPSRIVPVIIDPPNNLNTEHLPITTRKGKVVYKRKKHLFNEKDVLRVAGDVYAPEKEKFSAYWYEAIIQKFTLSMIDKIVNLLFGDPVSQQIAHRLYWDLHGALARIFTRLSEDDQAEITASGGAH